MPNDSAYPYDLICRLFRRRHVPFLLVQEGIRYAPPESAESASSRQGAGGATAIAAWGRSSARYFCASGAPEHRITLTGCPRFDVIENTDWGPRAAALAADLGIGTTKVLFLSNPIDDLGFCTPSEKTALFESFVQRLAPVFRTSETDLLVKLHPRESIEDFRRARDRTPFAGRVRILQQEPLYPLLHLADSAVTWGSSAGLEAMLFGLPLAVLEVPGAGFLHDFVSSGAATGLPIRGDLAGPMKDLLRDRSTDPAVERYLDESLATRSDATAHVTALISQLLANGTLPAPP